MVAKKGKGEQLQREDEGVEVQIRQKETNIHRIYANFARVSHSQHEFAINFCDIEEFSREAAKEIDGQLVIEAPIVAKIVMPHSIMLGLLNALQQNYKDFLQKIAEEAKGAEKEADNSKGAK